MRDSSQAKKSFILTGSTDCGQSSGESQGPRQAWLLAIMLRLPGCSSEGREHREGESTE